MFLRSKAFSDIWPKAAGKELAVNQSVFTEEQIKATVAHLVRLPNHEADLRKALSKPHKSQRVDVYGYAYFINPVFEQDRNYQKFLGVEIRHLSTSERTYLNTSGGVFVKDRENGWQKKFQDTEIEDVPYITIQQAAAVKGSLQSFVNIVSGIEFYAEEVRFADSGFRCGNGLPWIKKGDGYVIKGDDVVKLSLLTHRFYTPVAAPFLRAFN